MENFDYYAKQAEEALELGDADLAQEFLDLANEVGDLFSEPEPETVLPNDLEIPDHRTAYDLSYNDMDHYDVQKEPQEEEKESHGFLKHTGEAAVNILGAGGEIASELVGTVIDWPVQAIVDPIKDRIGGSVYGDPDQQSDAVNLIMDEEGTKLFSAFGNDFSWVSGEGLQRLKEHNLGKVWKAEDVVRAALFDLDDAKNMGMQETLTGQLSGGFSHFIGGWALLSPVKGLQITQNASKFTQFGQATFKGGVVDFSFFDAHNGRLADLAKQHGFENEFINFMAAEGNEDDSIFEGKMKNALEGSIAGVGLEVTLRFLMLGAKATRYGMKAFNPKLTPEQRADAAKKAEKAVEEVQSNFKDPSEVELKTKEGTPLVVETPEKVAQQFEAKVGTVVDTLPPELSKSTPRYNYGSTPIELTFENDIVKALYIVGGKGKSAKHDQYMDFLEQTGIKDIAGEAQKIRDYIKAQAKAGNTEVTIAKVKPRVKYTPAVDAPKPKPEPTEVPKTKKELDLATKEERAEMGSLRSPDDVGPPKIVTIEETVTRGNKLIADLLRNTDQYGILNFVKSLKEATIRPDGFDPAAWLTGMKTLTDSVDEALYKIEASAEYKAGDEAAILRKKQLVEARHSLHAQREAAGSGFGRGLNVLRQMFDNTFKPDLSKLWGKELEEAKAKIIDDAIKQKKKQKKNQKEKTELDKAAEEGDLTPSEIEEIDPFTKRMLSRLSRTASTSKEWMDKIVEFGVGNLLLNTDTILVNKTINAAMKLMNDFETAGGALVAGLRGDRAAAARQLRRGKYQAMSIARHNQAAWRATWEVLMTGKNVLDPEFKVKEEVDGYHDTVAIGTHDFDLRKLGDEWHEDMTYDEMMQLVANVIGNTNRGGIRVLAAGDEYFKQLNFRGIYGGLIQEEFIEAGRHIDLDDATFLQLIDDKIAEGIEVLAKARLKEEPLTEIEEAMLGKLLYAQQQSRVATFTDDLGSFGKWIQQGANKFPAVRIMSDAWFIRTPTNVFKYQVRRAPVISLASRRYREMLWRSTKDDRDRVIFENLYMTAAAFAIWDMVQEKVKVPDGNGGHFEMYKWQGTLDHLTYQNVKSMEAAGLQRHSVYDEDSGTFYKTARGAPFDNLIVTMSNIRDLEETGEYEGAYQMMWATIVSYMNMMKDQTFTSGMTNFVEFLNSPDFTVKKYLEAKARTFTPKLLKLWGEQDEYRREVDGMLEASQSMIPIFSKGLDPKFDFLGHPIPKPDKSGFKILSPATNISDSEVRRELLRLAPHISDDKPVVGLLDLQDDAFKVDGITAWNAYNKALATIKIPKTPYGKTLEEKLRQVIRSEAYQDTATDSTVTPFVDEGGSREDLIQDVVNKYRKAALYAVAKDRRHLGLHYIVQKEKQIEAKAKSQKFVDDITETNPAKLIQQFYKEQLADPDLKPVAGMTVKELRQFYSDKLEPELLDGLF